MIMHGVNATGPQRPNHGTPGFVLPAVMFGLVVMAVMGAASLRASGDEQRSVQAFRESSAAFYAGEGGLRKTIAEWPTTTVAAMNPGDSLDLGWQTLANGAKYRAVIHEVDNAASLQVYLVIVQGRGPKGNGGQRTVEAVVAAQPVFKYAIYATQNITMGSNTFIDGFNSEEAPYNLLTAHTDADLVALGNVALGPTLLNGNVMAGGTASNTLLVTGSVTSSATSIPTYSTVSCPSTGYTPASAIPSGTGISYDPTTGALTVTSTANLVLSGSQYYFSSVTVTGQGKITVTSTSHVDIYIANEFSMAGQGLANTGQSAAQLTLSSCGTSSSGSSTWQVGGNADAYYSIYAPNKDIQISGHTDTYGSVLGRNVTFSGNSRMHYDAAVANNEGTTLAVVSGSWAELTQY
jgi:hypothetical protein